MTPEQATIVGLVLLLPVILLIIGVLVAIAVLWFCKAFRRNEQKNRPGSYPGPDQFRGR